LPAFSPRASSIPLRQPHLGYPNLLSSNTLRHPTPSPVPPFPPLFSAPRHSPLDRPASYHNSQLLLSQLLTPPSPLRRVHHPTQISLAATRFSRTRYVFLSTFSKFRLFRSNNSRFLQEPPTRRKPLVGRTSSPSRRTGGPSYAAHLYLISNIRKSTTLPRGPSRINAASCATRHGRRQRVRSGVFRLTDRRELGILGPCLDDCELPAGGMRTMCSIGPWDGCGFSPGGATSRPSRR